MDVIKRMGILYGKLGLSTAQTVIEARYQGVIAACEEIGQKHITNLVGSALGLKGYDLNQDVMSFFSEKDPAFDVDPHDKEAALLASAVIAYAFAETLEVEDSLALCLVTASFGSVRSGIADDNLVGLAEKKLAELQTGELKIPADKKYTVRSKECKDAVEAFEQPNMKTHAQFGLPATQTALQELGEYAESVAKAATLSDNSILRYLRSLESEVRVYWWASSGWCAETSSPFKQLGGVEAAIRAGKELADKSNASSLGLFAAPALLSMVLERGREGVPKPVTLASAATAIELSWRKSNFQPLAEGIHANLMPLSTAMGIAASSDDQDDWQPRFERLTGLKVAQKLTIEQLAIQMYRERLVASVLK